MTRTIIIAEAGVNHNGSLEMAKELVRVAARAGADYVKFQTFRPELSIARGTPKAAYQQRNTGADEDMMAMVKKLELPFEAFAEIDACCRAEGIRFISTPFDLPSVQLLDQMDVPLLKIPSGEITNPELMLAMVRTGRPVILSTGMSTLGEVENALGVLAFGYLGRPDADAGRRAFAAAFASDEGQQVLAEKVTLLHCTTEYPARIEDVNLRAMQTLRAAFGLPVGYSDHSVGVAVPTAAVALGAVVIEKHFTLDKALPGPDHKASADPQELAAMVASIRTVETALGKPVKRPSAVEQANADVARKSLVAARPIRAGHVFAREDLAIKRPGTGIPPMQLWEVVGTVAQRDYDIDELID
jgi:N-acetylneuraminate synthase